MPITVDSPRSEDAKADQLPQMLRLPDHRAACTIPFHAKTLDSCRAFLPSTTTRAVGTCQRRRRFRPPFTNSQPTPNHHTHPPRS